MSFQGYLTTIKAKTGKGPEDFRRLAAEKGLTDGENIKPGVKAGDIVAWLKQDFGLGHGHAGRSCRRSRRCRDRPFATPRPRR